MTKVKSRQFVWSSRTSFSAGAMFLMLAVTAFTPLPARCGPQSALDPYSDIQPEATQADSKPLRGKKGPKPKGPGQQPSISSDLGNRTSSKNPSPPIKSTNNPSFLSGIKEVGHGSITSFKAAGHGIISGSKAAGAKIASGTKSVAGGAKALGGKLKNNVTSTGDKIAEAPKAIAAKGSSPKPKKTNQDQIARANAHHDPNAAPLPELPGKPLGELVNSYPAPKPAHSTRKKNVIARGFNKLNPFAKKTQAASLNISATDHQQQGVNQ